MSTVAMLGALVSTAAISAPPQTDKSTDIANISDTIQKSGSKPTGYKGADGKVVVEKGTVKTTGVIEGTDAGFFVAFPAVDVKGAKHLSLDVKGRIFQQQGWDHLASIQIMDEDGERHILLEVCKEGKYGSCAGQPKTKPSALRKGTTIKLKLPAGLETVARIEVVFIGQTKVDAGFTLSNIKLVK